MIQSGDGFGFAFEPLLTHRIIRNLRRQDFYRYHSFEPCVLRPINLSHSARAQRSDNLIRPEFIAWSEGHRCRDYSSAAGPHDWHFPSNTLEFKWLSAAGASSRACSIREILLGRTPHRRVAT